MTGRLGNHPFLNPGTAAAVANPARNECPDTSLGSIPANSARRLTTSATPRSVIRASPMFPCRSTGRNTAPSCSPAASIHAPYARTGHVAGLDPYGTPTRRPAASWSIFERRKVTTNPSRVCSMSSTFRSASSDDEVLQRTREVEARGHVPRQGRRHRSALVATNVTRSKYLKVRARVGLSIISGLAVMAARSTKYRTRGDVTKRLAHLAGACREPAPRCRAVVSSVTSIEGGVGFGHQDRLSDLRTARDAVALRGGCRTRVRQT